MKTWQSVLLGSILSLGFFAILTLVVQPPRGEPIVLPPTTTITPLVVYITGAVQHPGLVNVSRPARVSNAIELAGGLTEEADTAAINLAKLLVDGEKIVIPSIRNAATQSAEITIQALSGGQSKVTPASTPNYPIDINVATQQELEILPNIGAIKAAVIIEYRNLHGPFKSIEDIQNVPNIGPSTFEKIKTLITVSY